METPDLVQRIAAAMVAASPVEVTVKCRIGVDDQDPRQVLPDLLARLREAGVARVAIHARKAWLQGLSPKENREVPPLDYGLVHEMKARFRDLHISVNGGVQSLAEARAFLEAGLDGVMIGRAAYHAPADILLPADRIIFGEATVDRTPHEIARAMLPYIARQMAEGHRLHAVTRHMLGLFTGRPGARAWRRHLSEQATRDGAGPEVVEAALALVPEEAARTEASNEALAL
jgi:tRNA-dihydrouridine synthase A